MIIFDLICEHKHSFEGWFRSADDFQQQLDRQLLACPTCNSQSVRRIPSAVAIGGNHRAHTEAGASSHSLPATPSRPDPAPVASPTQVLAVYRQMVQTLLSQSEDVGQQFADEARRIHYQESEPRLIHGQATRDECEALNEEGIEILQIPVFRDADLN